MHISDQLELDFSAPDIMRARAAAYALLLRWAKERKDAETKALAQGRQQRNGERSPEQICQNADNEYTDRNQQQSSTSVGAEVELLR